MTSQTHIQPRMRAINPKSTAILTWMTGIEDCDEPEVAIQEVTPEIYDDISDVDDGGAKLSTSPKSEPMKLMLRDGSLRTLCVPSSDSSTNTSATKVAPAAESTKTEPSQSSELLPAKRMDYAAAIKELVATVQPAKLTTEPAIVLSGTKKPVKSSTPERKAAHQARDDSRRRSQDRKKPVQAPTDAKTTTRCGFEKKQRAFDQPWR